MHAAYCEARGLDLVLLPPAERQWFDAMKLGMTPEDVRMVIKARKERIRAGIRHEECLCIRNIAGSEEAVANSLEEVAIVKAKMRVKVFDAGKREVLRATGRLDQPEQGRMIPVKDVIEGLRSAVG